MYLLDSNHCSYLLDGRAGVAARVRAVDPELLATCEIVRGEMLYMTARSRDRERNLARVRELFDRFAVFPVDEAAAASYADLKDAVTRRFGPRDRRKAVPVARLGFSDNDLWIAAVALARDLTVLSGDGDFSRMREAEPRLRVESWVAG